MGANLFCTRARACSVVSRERERWVMEREMESGGEDFTLSLGWIDDSRLPSSQVGT